MATPSIAPRSAQSGLFNQSRSVRASLRMSGSICKASWRLAVQPCLPNGATYSRQRATRCFAHNLGPWHHGSGRRVAPNNSFKPNLLRYGNGVAEEACHAVTCATQFGLTQALAGARSRVKWCAIASRCSFLPTLLERFPRKRPRAGSRTRLRTLTRRARFGFVAQASVRSGQGVGVGAQASGCGPTFCAS